MHIHVKLLKLSFLLKNSKLTGFFFPLKSKLELVSMNVSLVNTVTVYYWSFES